MSLFQLVYGKTFICLLNHKFNFSLDRAGNHRKPQLNELEYIINLMKYNRLAMMLMIVLKDIRIK